MPVTDNKNLQEGNTKATIEPTGKDTAQGAGANPEDTRANVDYQAIIDAQTKTIEKQQELVEQLLDRVNDVNAQISMYVRSVGAPAPDGINPPDDGTKPPAGGIPEDYVYLKDLGKEIGKR